MLGNSELNKMADLEGIIDYMLNDSTDQVPEFLKRCEGRTVSAVQAYTRKTAPQDAGDITGLVEDCADGLFDSIRETNYEYLKNGMKLGILILMQMLDI